MSKEVHWESQGSIPEVVYNFTILQFYTLQSTSEVGRKRLLSRYQQGTLGSKMRRITQNCSRKVRK